MNQDCKKVRTSTAEFEQHYVSLDIPLDAGAVDPAAPDCGQCWMLLVILCRHGAEQPGREARPAGDVKG